LLFLCLEKTKNMAIIFKFRMLSDENDHFVRDYEVPYDMTLADFHDFIRETLEYEESMVSFHTADDRWEKLQEFTLMDMGMGTDGSGPLPMSEVTLHQILHHVHDRLIYQFDLFADRAYYLELLDVAKAVPGTVYPREAFAHGSVPDQFDPDATAADGSIFDEMMDEFSGFEGDENYDDEY